MTTPNTPLPDFDAEMSTTRRLLERVPMDRADWKPHAKSTALGALAAHIAALARFGGIVAGMDELDLGAAGPRPSTSYATTDALLAAFDENVANSRTAILALDPASYDKPWTLRSGAHVIFSLPRALALRTMLVNHMIHHRGQLSVYLRELDVPLPSIYGPTADEPR